MSTQNGWRWCHKCQGFFFAGNPSQGACPADHQAHDASQSAHYAAVVGDGILPFSETVTVQPPGLFPAAFGVTNPFAGAAVFGESTSHGVGLFGLSKNGVGVQGVCSTGAATGVYGSTNSQFQPGPDGVAGVWGENSGSGTGVKGTSVGGDGVLGFSGSKDHAGVSAVNTAAGGFGLWAAGTPAGHFEGDVEVTGNINVSGDLILKNQDCAEDFDIADAATIEPGAVMVIEKDGALRMSRSAYDKRVAGVISGAGNLKPGIVLGKQPSQDNRMPLALLGKVYCKVDADCSPVEVGDLLTTSPTPGHAMKATDPLKAFGCVIGKALRPLAAGRGLIPILIALQ
jgi:hypothetical protein